MTWHHGRPHDDRMAWDHDAQRSMGGWWWLLAGNAALVILFILFSPLICAIALYEWMRVARADTAPNPFLPEDPQSAKAWAEKMERARRLQAEQERDD